MELRALNIPQNIWPQSYYRVLKLLLFKNVFKRLVFFIIFFTLNYIFFLYVFILF
jgi:hypothetical protein